MMCSVASRYNRFSTRQTEPGRILNMPLGPMANSTLSRSTFSLPVVSEQIRVRRSSF